MITKVNLKQKMDLISDYWNPKIAGVINDHEVRLVKFKGDLCFHKHDDEDEMFLVLSGSIKIDFKDKVTELNTGEFLIIPKGTIHKPIANEEAYIMMFVKSTNINTGDISNELTRSKLESI